jgi:hypothetical protein
MEDAITHPTTRARPFLGNTAARAVSWWDGNAVELASGSSDSSTGTKESLSVFKYVRNYAFFSFKRYITRCARGRLHSNTEVYPQIILSISWQHADLAVKLPPVSIYFWGFRPISQSVNNLQCSQVPVSNALRTTEPILSIF